MDAVSQGHITRPDGDGTHFRNGIGRIDTQVCEDLIDLSGVHHHRPQRLSRQPDQVDVFSDEPPQHIEHALDCFVEVQHMRGDVLLAGKSQQLAGQVRRSLGGLANLQEVLVERLPGGRPLSSQAPRFRESRPACY